MPTWKAKWWSRKTGIPYRRRAFRHFEQSAHAGRRSMNSYLSLSLAICLAIVGQLLFKGGALHASAAGNSWVNVHLAVGLTAYFVSALFYIYALRDVRLSVAFPSISISYVAVAYLAHVFYGEPFGVRQILALGFIGGGISLLASS